MLKTLLNSLKGTDWHMLTDFVSPVFFEVVPTLGMASVFANIAKDYANKTQFEIIRGDVRERVANRLNVKLESQAHLAKDQAKSQLTDDDKRRLGEKVLEMYFAQIFHCDTSILDLRSGAFISQGLWAPNSIFYRWNPSFKAAIKKMYSGFYHDDNVLFLDGLRALDLEHAAGIFKTHFGSGNQDAVKFDLSEFKKSFHSIFLSCKTHKTKLHPDFFALGVYLVCLYENLQTIGLPLNVRAAFLKAEGLS
jgi:hypothetical protein